MPFLPCQPVALMLFLPLLPVSAPTRNICQHCNLQFTDEQYILHLVRLWGICCHWGDQGQPSQGEIFNWEGGSPVPFSPQDSPHGWGGGHHLFGVTFPIVIQTRNLTDFGTAQLTLYPSSAPFVVGLGAIISFGVTYPS